MTRTRSALALALLASTGLGAGALLALTSEGAATGSQSLQLAGPVDADANAERKLREQVADHTENCETAPRQPSGPEADTVIDAVAAIACDAEAVAAGRLEVYQFTDNDTVKEHLDEYTDTRRVYGSCSGGEGDTRWSTRAGRERGTMICLDRGSRRIVWTDERRKTVSSLSSGSASLGVLARWWQRTYRPETDASRRDAQALARRVRQVVAGARCSRTVEHSPLAAAAVACKLPGGDYEDVDALVVERLASRPLLRKRIAAAGTALAHAAADGGGGKHVFRGGWLRGTKPAGTLVVYPSFGDHWYIWTFDRPRLHVRYLLRGGGEKRAFEVWQEHLSRIGT